MQKSVISLREVARRLGEFRKPKRIIDPDKLLSLLKSGALSAGFEFPGRKIVLWIPIPQNYWLTVHMHKFQSLGFQLDDPSSGTFTVRISEFSEELTKSVTQTVNDASKATEELSYAFAKSSRPYEVVITDKEWASYLERNDLRYPVLENKKTSGRHEKASWARLSVIIGAYLTKHFRETKEPLQPNKVAPLIHQLAENEEISDLPSIPTIRDHISNILKKANSLSK
jgi:hypothetical protein